MHRPPTRRHDAPATPVAAHPLRRWGHWAEHGAAERSYARRYFPETGALLGERLSERRELGNGLLLGLAFWLAPVVLLAWLLWRATVLAPQVLAVVALIIGMLALSVFVGKLFGPIVGLAAAVHAVVAVLVCAQGD